MRERIKREQRMAFKSYASYGYAGTFQCSVSVAQQAKLFGEAVSRYFPPGCRLTQPMGGYAL